jgi:hypothetical protein
MKQDEAGSILRRRAPRIGPAITYFGCGRRIRRMRAISDIARALLVSESAMAARIQTALAEIERLEPDGRRLPAAFGLAANEAERAFLAGQIAELSEPG